MRSGSKAARWEQTTRRPEWWGTVPRAQRAVRRHLDEREAGARSPVFAAHDSHTRNFLAATPPTACQVTRCLYFSRAHLCIYESMHQCLSSNVLCIQQNESQPNRTHRRMHTHTYVEVVCHSWLIFVSSFLPIDALWALTWKSKIV